MANTILAHKNRLLEPGVSISATTAVANCPTTRLFDEKAFGRFVFDGRDGELVIDLGEPRKARLVALVHHNLVSAQVVTLEANGTDLGASPAYGPVTVPYSPKNMWLDLGGDLDYRFWRIRIGLDESLVVDPETEVYGLAGESHSLQANAKIGQLYIGPYVQFQRNFLLNYGLARHRPMAIKSTSAGIDWRYALNNPSKGWNLSWKMGAEDLGLYEGFRNTVKDGARPFLFVPDPGHAQRMAYWVRCGPSIAMKGYAYKDLDWLTSGSDVFAEEPLPMVA